MPMHRKNKCSRYHARNQNEPWFIHHKKRVRMRKKMAKRSKQINRRIAKGRHT